MKLIRKAGAPVLKTPQGATMEAPVIETIKTQIMHGQSLYIKLGMFAYDGARDEKLGAIYTKELLFTDTPVLPKWHKVVTETQTDPTLGEISVDVTYVVTPQVDGSYGYSDGDGNVVVVSPEELSTLPMVDLGQGDYVTVLGKVVIDGDKVTITDPEAQQWLLAHKDWEGMPFGQNWDLV